jgi:hypothetical protein
MNLNNENNMTTIGYALLIQRWNGSSYSPDFDGITVYMDMAEAQKVKAELEAREWPLDVRVHIITAEIK